MFAQGPIGLRVTAGARLRGPGLEAVEGAAPESLDGVITEFGLDAIAGAPGIEDSSAQVASGATVRIPVSVSAPRGATPTQVIDWGPAIGTARRGDDHRLRRTREGRYRQPDACVRSRLPEARARPTVTVQITPPNGGAGGGPWAAPAPKLRQRLLGIGRLGTAKGLVRVAVKVRPSAQGRMQITIATAQRRVYASAAAPGRSWSART